VWGTPNGSHERLPHPLDISPLRRHSIYLGKYRPSKEYTNYDSSIC